ncbi:unnamed protein product [Lasius platythorax]|uniref:Uncharacterized protein n=1 Tax=Lasius platythorax TaxID=488582 RepID=A0AAV2NZQ4_9HYME
MCRTVPSIRAKEKAESGRKGTVWGPCVLMRRPLLHRRDSGSRSAVRPASQFPAVASHSRRFCGLASPLGKLDIARCKMARVTQYG